jgi:hypothetical protein
MTRVSKSSSQHRKIIAIKNPRKFPVCEYKVMKVRAPVFLTRGIFQTDRFVTICCACAILQVYARSVQSPRVKLMRQCSKNREKYRKKENSQRDHVNAGRLGAQALGRMKGFLKTAPFTMSN